MGDDNPVAQFNKITDQIYLGTNLCCTSKTHNQILVDEGIEADIDMELESDGQIPGVNFYLRLPVKDHEAPTISQLNVGVAAINELIKNNKKIYIHCKEGHGRSPTLVAAYFIYQGMTSEKALDEVRIKRPEIHLEISQIQVLKDYEKQIRKTTP